MKNAPKILVNERIRFEELKKAFPHRWVVLKNTHRIGNSPKIDDAVFLYKHKNQDRAFAKIPDLQEKGLLGKGDVLSVEYTGGKWDELEYIFVI